MLENIKLTELDKNNIDHLKIMYDVRTHPDVCLYLRGSPPINFDTHVKYLSHIGAHKRFYIINSPSDLCGYCHVTMSDSENKIEVGIALHPKHSNQGIGSIAMTHLLQIIEKSEWGRGKTIILYVKKDNLRAIVVYEKNGFYTANEENEFGEYLMEKIHAN